MGERCPFCWGDGVTEVRRELGAPTVRRRLMQCPDCEKWYWQDTGEEIARLFLICETPYLNGGGCDEEVKTLVRSGKNGLPRRRLTEFNHLCSQCPERHLVRF